MEEKDNFTELTKELRKTVLRTLICPVLVLAFFLVAPCWLNSKVRAEFVTAIHDSPHLSDLGKTARTQEALQLDFERLVEHPDENPAFWRALDEVGTVGRFGRLRWSRHGSLFLMEIIGFSLVAISVLGMLAKRSQRWLVRAYRWSWCISMAAAVVQVFLLVPLLVYGCFELSVLLTGYYVPKLLVVIGVAGLGAIWLVLKILCTKVPMQFGEAMCRDVTPEDAPELWRAIEGAAEQLNTAPPDRIIIGAKLSFYVTELAVKHENGIANGRSLYLSYPLLRHLSGDEVLSIIGHELGHFMGDDTRMTREFYPMRLKVQAMRVALAKAPLVGWTSFQFLNYFFLNFARTEQATSRQRELLADQKGALLTSPSIFARALVKFHILSEAFSLGVNGDKLENPLEMPLYPVVRDQLIPKTEFWSELFKKKQEHPLDSHPPLNARLEALGESVALGEAQMLVQEDEVSAYDLWFANRTTLFAEINQKAERVITEIRTQNKVAKADYKSEEGKELLEEHFPEKRWRRAVWTTVFASLVYGGLAVGSLALAPATHDGPGLKVILLFGGLAFAVLGVRNWLRHYKGELQLTAGAIFYTGWKRPLSFEEVRHFSGLKNNSVLTARFHLKEGSVPIWKYATPYKRGVVELPLSGFGQRQDDIYKELLKYITRQVDLSRETAEAADIEASV